VEPVRPGVQVLAQALGLDVPQSEQGPGRDLRLGVAGAQRGPFGQDLGGHRDELVHHVALVGPQRGRGADQVAEAPQRRGGPAGIVLTGQPAGHAAELAVQDRQRGVDRRDLRIGQPGPERRHRGLQAVQDERLLGGEVVEDRLLRYPAGLRDIRHAHRVEAVLHEHPRRGV
jgi:hypothetical protein